MSLYLIYARDRVGSGPLRMKVRNEHVARVKEFASGGRVLLAGPMTVNDTNDVANAVFAGSMIVAEFDSLESATEWFEQDPYVKLGVFESYEIRPFIKLLP